MVHHGKHEDCDHDEHLRQRNHHVEVGVDAVSKDQEWVLLHGFLVLFQILGVDHLIFIRQVLLQLQFV